MNNKARKTHIRAYGLTVPLSNHKDVKKLKNEFSPVVHGNKVWSSSWLLIDYINKNGFVPGLSVLEIGCGWGLSGIYCVKKQKAHVTGIDMDDEVLPYLELMAEKNKVTVDFKKLGFDQVRRNILKDVDVIIGSDICFYESMTDSLRRLIQRAKNAGVQQIMIADPGRQPFDDLAALYAGKNGSEVLEWSTRRPRNIYGRILKIEFLRLHVTGWRT